MYVFADSTWRIGARYTISTSQKSPFRFPNLAMLGVTSHGLKRVHLRIPLAMFPDPTIG